MKRTFTMRRRLASTSLVLLAAAAAIVQCNAPQTGAPPASSARATDRERRSLPGK
jgi:hypothetical protein